jgi:hypothetical protein
MKNRVAWGMVKVLAVTLAIAAGLGLWHSDGAIQMGNVNVLIHPFDVWNLGCWELPSGHQVSLGCITVCIVGEVW